MEISVAMQQEKEPVAIIQIRGGEINASKILKTP